jgi:hypothetical protein
VKNSVEIKTIFAALKEFSSLPKNPETRIGFSRKDDPQ